MDELARYNQARWEELAQARVEYSRPSLNLDSVSARAVVDAQGLIGDVTGKDVLCLAAGGGQQSAAFGLLGAKVTVFDLSPTQLARDREAAGHYGLAITTVQGDMRDLSCFDAAAFDIVWHAYSINFVPDARPVLREVARILHPGGLYRGQWWNPFTRTVDSSSWNGQGYLLSHPYAEGVDVTRLNPGWDTWEVNDEDGTLTRVASPMEYNHKLSTIVNTLAELGFVILRLDEAMGETPADANAEPGSWPHYQSVAPPFLTLWARFQPNIGS